MVESGPMDGAGKAEAEMSNERGVTIRAATDDDAAALAQLVTEFTGLETSTEQLVTRLQQSRGVEHPVVALQDGAIVGFASVRLHPYLGEDQPYAELSELFVQEAHRRQGIARALVQVLEQRARRAGATAWTVLTGEDNPAALAFYQSLGFRPFAVALQQWFSDKRPYRVPQDEMAERDR